MSDRVVDLGDDHGRLRDVVAAFYRRAVDDPVVGHHFAELDLRALADHQAAFVLHLVGGPGVRWDDDQLRDAHRGLGITHGEFDRMVDLLVDTLADHDVAPADVALVEAAFRRRRDVVVVAGTA